MKRHSSMEQREHCLQAKNPRDKIYTLLGMASDYQVSKRIAERDALKVVPNYALSCVEIYTDFAIAIMIQGNSSILSLCQFPKSISGLPSWVPDWSTPLKPPFQAPMGCHERVLLPPYHAGGPSSAGKVQFHWTEKNETVCSITGLVLNKIAATGTTYSEITEKSRDAIAWVREWLGVLNDLSKQRTGVYGSGVEHWSVIVRTSMADFCTDATGKVSRVTENVLIAACMMLLIVVGEEELQNSGILKLLEQKAADKS